MPKRLPMPEFVAIIGVLFATVAFSIDAMLPAMGDIARELSPAAPNRAQLIITSFVLGMGLGTLVTGPLSDAYGRKAVILGGAAVYMAGSLLAAMAGTLETLLAARVLQGLGAAGPRIAALAVVRDLYDGRQMARVMSFAMLVFTLVPALAPLIGAGIIALTGWRGIFAAFVLFSLVTSAWFALRQAETLAPEARRPFRADKIAEGIAEVVQNRQVVIVIAALALVFGMLFTTLSSAQPVFDRHFGRAESFPYWFGGIALISGSAALLNARVVVRLGMRRVIMAALAAQLALSAGMLALTLAEVLPETVYFGVYLAWTTSLFLMAGLTIGNLNALGMEPLGHLAGLGASIIGSVATVGAVLLAAPISLAADGTPLPLTVGILVLCAGALACMRLSGAPRPIAEA